MTKRTFYVTAVLLLVIATGVYFIGRRCTTYFSNSSAQVIPTKFFDVECKIYPGTNSQDSDEVQVNVLFKNESYKNISNLKIQVNDAFTGYLLKADLKADSTGHTFWLPKNNKEVNLTLDYDTYSFAFDIHKQRCYSHLKRVNIYRESFVLH